MSVLLSSLKSLTMGIKAMFSNKAYFQTESGKKLHVQFNPEQFRITKMAKYSSSDEKEQPFIVYSGVALPQLDISFFFDTSGIKELSKVGSVIESDVTVLTNEFAGLVHVDASLHRPPVVQFVWGSVCFSGFVEQVATTYTKFNKNGMPVQAKVDAHLTGMPEVSQSKIPLQSPDRTKSRVVSAETDLWRLAGSEYGDISKWREIAKANGIMDPFDIPAGTALKVPAL